MNWYVDMSYDNPPDGWDADRGMSSIVGSTNRHIRFAIELVGYYYLLAVAVLQSRPCCCPRFYCSQLFLRVAAVSVARPYGPYQVLHG